MKISRIIATDDDGKEVIFQIKEGAGIFITEDNQTLTLATDNEYINMGVLRNILIKYPQTINTQKAINDANDDKEKKE